MGGSVSRAGASPRQAAATLTPAGLRDLVAFLESLESDDLLVAALLARGAFVRYVRATSLLRGYLGELQVGLLPPRRTAKDRRP